MADLGYFDPNTVPPSEFNFDPLPVGTYDLQAVEADILPTKSGDGKRLTLTLEVLTGEYTNRKIFESINIANSSAQAQAIGQRQLADLILAGGLGAIQDSDEILFKPFKAKVGIQRDKNGEYEPRNVVKRYLPASASQAMRHPERATARERGLIAEAKAQPPKPATGGARPWANR